MILTKFLLIENTLSKVFLGKCKSSFLPIIYKNDGKFYNTESVPKIRFAARPPYIIFSNDNMAALRHKNPNLPMVEIAKRLGQMWRDLPQLEKEKYSTRYVEERNIIDAEKKTKLESMSEDQRKIFMAEQGELKKKKRLKHIKMLKKKFNKPKASDVNPYVLFVKSKFLDRGDASFATYVRGVRDYWLKMTDEDKKPFVLKARENTARYQKQLAEWDRRMLASGYKSLISKSRLNILLSKNITKRPRRKRKIALASSKVKAVKTKVSKDTKTVNETKKVVPVVANKTPVKKNTKASDGTGDKQSVKEINKTKKDVAKKTASSSASVKLSQTPTRNK